MPQISPCVVAFAVPQKTQVEGSRDSHGGEKMALKSDSFRRPTSHTKLILTKTPIIQYEGKLVRKIGKQKTICVDI